MTENWRGRLRSPRHSARTRARFAAIAAVATIAMSGFGLAAVTASADEPVPPGNLATANPSDEVDIVTVGAYIDNIPQIEMSSNSFKADLYVWYRWTNPDIAPYETIEIMNPYESWQLMVTPAQEEPTELDDGSLYYVTRYQGAFTSKMNLSRFPFSKQTLHIDLEDVGASNDSIRFVADSPTVAINEDLTLAGYSLKSTSMTVTDHTYPTNFGDGSPQDIASYSRVVVDVNIESPIFASIVKFLLPIILVIATASLIFQIPPTLVEARIGLGITALLTLVAMQWTANDGLPFVEYLTFLDALYIVSFVFIIGTIIQAIYTTWVARRDVEDAEDRAIKLDEKLMFVYLAIYVLAGVFTAWLFLFR